MAYLIALIMALVAYSFGWLVYKVASVKSGHAKYFATMIVLFVLVMGSVGKLIELKKANAANCDCCKAQAKG